MREIPSELPSFPVDFSIISFHTNLVMTITNITKTTKKSAKYVEQLSSNNLTYMQAIDLYIYRERESVYGLNCLEFIITIY